MRFHLTTVVFYPGNGQVDPIDGFPDLMSHYDWCLEAPSLRQAIQHVVYEAVDACEDEFGDCVGVWVTEINGEPVPDDFEVEQFLETSH
jgi:hypothetical protein